MSYCEWLGPRLDSRYNVLRVTYVEKQALHESNRRKIPSFLSFIASVDGYVQLLVAQFHLGHTAACRYLNNTGLMWESAPKMGAMLVFAEHRWADE